MALVRRHVFMGIVAKKGIIVMLLHYDEFASPIGRILFASDEKAVCALDFEDYRERMNRLLSRRF